MHEHPVLASVRCWYETLPPDQAEMTVTLLPADDEYASSITIRSLIDPSAPVIEVLVGSHDPRFVAPETDFDVVVRGRDERMVDHRDARRVGWTTPDEYCRGLFSGSDERDSGRSLWERLVHRLRPKKTLA